MARRKREYTIRRTLAQRQWQSCSWHDASRQFSGGAMQGSLRRRDVAGRTRLAPRGRVLSASSRVSRFDGCVSSGIVVDRALRRRADPPGFAAGLCRVALQVSQDAHWAATGTSVALTVQKQGGALESSRGFAILEREITIKSRAQRAEVPTSCDRGQGDAGWHVAVRPRVFGVEMGGDARDAESHGDFKKRST